MSITDNRVFDREQGDMRDFVEEIILEEFGYDHIVQEFPHGSMQTRTDVVGVNIDPEKVKLREELFGEGNTIATSRDLFETYCYIAKHGPMTKREWRSEDVIRSSHKNRWDDLERKGFLKVDGESKVGYVVPIPIHVDAHAFELKREYWKRGKEQAVDAVRRKIGREFYTGYASQASVVVDAGVREHPRDDLPEWPDRGVSIHSVDKSGLETLQEGKVYSPDPRSRDLLHLNEISYAGIEPIWGQPESATATFAGESE